MRTILQPLKGSGSDRRAIARPAEILRPLDESELDQVAAAGGSKGGGLGSGGGGLVRTLTVQPD